MDYKQLLIKYINHVGCQEGITFINRTTEDDARFLGKEFSEEEKKELVNLDKAARDYYEEVYSKL